MKVLRQALLLAIHAFAMILPPYGSRQLWRGIGRLLVWRSPPASWPPETAGGNATERKAAWQRRVVAFDLSSWLMCSGSRLDRKAIDRYFGSTGIEHLHGAMSAGHGVIVVMVHQVGIRAIALGLKQENLTPYWLARPLDPGLRHPMRRLRLWQHRLLFGADSLLYTDGAGTRRLYALLRRGGMVCMAQDVIGDRYRVTVLGKEISLSLGAVRLALSTGALLVPAVAVVEGDRLQARFGAPLPVHPDEETLANAMAQQIESLIRTVPELWTPQW